MFYFQNPLWLRNRRVRTPKSQAISNKKDAFPTATLGLMLLIKPGRAGGIDKRSAIAALQFYYDHENKKSFPIIRRKRQRTIPFQYLYLPYGSYMAGTSTLPWCTSQYCYKNIVQISYCYNKPHDGLTSTTMLGSFR